jgi:hypothetical protein
VTSTVSRTLEDTALNNNQLMVVTIQFGGVDRREEDELGVWNDGR